MTVSRTINISWKGIEGYEGYYVISNTGLVKGLERSVPRKKGQLKIKAKFINTRINNRGYVEVRISKEGKTTTKMLHVLLAEIFIPNPHSKKEVNHKNGIKTDNQLSNLEWVSHSENMKHAYQTGLCKKRNQKPVKDVCMGKIFPSIKEAAKFYMIPYGTFKNYLNGNRKKPECLEILPLLAA